MSQVLSVLLCVAGVVLVSLFPGPGVTSDKAVNPSALGYVVSYVLLFVTMLMRLLFLLL